VAQNRYGHLPGTGSDRCAVIRSSAAFTVR
jgi:hypothetical protein